MPSRQRRPVFDDVARGPKNPPLVEASRHIVVRTQDIEVSGLHPFDHEVDGLLRRPGSGRLLGAASGSKAGKDEPGDKKMRAQPLPRCGPQLVLQRFRKSFHARLRHIVGGIAGRGRDALLRAGVDDEAGSAALDHARRENLRTVNHAPEVHAENALPVLQRAEHLAARLYAGIVHQDIGAAEPLSHGEFQSRHSCDATDVNRRDHDTGAAAWRCRRYLHFCLSETVAGQIGDTNLHAETSEPHRGGKADTGRATGDDGNAIWRHGWVGHASSPDVQGIVLLNDRTMPTRRGYHARNGMGGLRSTLSRGPAFCEHGEPITKSRSTGIFGADMKYPSLFSPLQVGPYRLNHRVVMAPLTRMRAERPSLAPRPLNAEYYAQRATPGGLIIAEASPVMATGHGSPGTPGIY